MKTTGMVRQLDSLGRIVLPIELRRTWISTQRTCWRSWWKAIPSSSASMNRTATSAAGNSGLIPIRDKMICKRCLNEIKAL